MSLKRAGFCIALTCSMAWAASPAAADEPTPGAPASPAQAVTPAAAPNEAALREARSRYQRGVDLYQEGDYKLALIEFDRANELAPSYKILYNIGEVHFQLNNYSLALKALTRYLAEGGTEVAAKRRAEVEKDIETLKARVARLTIKTDVVGAEVFIDDVLVGKSPLEADLPVDAGNRRITATMPGHTPALKTITLAGQDSKVIELELPDASAPVVLAAQPNYGAYVGWGSMGLLAVGALVTGVTANSADTRYKELLNQKDVKAQDIQDKKSERNTLAITSDVLTGAAVVAGGIALYFTIKGTKSSSERGTGTGYLRPMLSPNNVGVAGVF